VPFCSQASTDLRLSSGDSLVDLGCPDYEVVKVEPLHDSKTIISNWLKDLPVHYPPEGILHLQLIATCRQAIGEFSSLTAAILETKN